MRKLWGLIVLVVFIIALGVINISAEINTEWRYVYDAESLSSKLAAPVGEMTATYVQPTNDDPAYIHVVSNGITSGAQNKYVRFDFFSDNSSREFNIKYYPYVSILYKTDISSTSTLSINVSVLNSSVNKFVRLWGLSKPLQADEELHSAIFDLTAVTHSGPEADENGYNGTLSTEFGNIDQNSGARYVRIPIWNETSGGNAGEYFDIYYIGFFQSYDSALCYGSSEQYTVTFYDGTNVYSTYRSNGGDQVILPDDPTPQTGYRFAHWYTNEVLYGGESVETIINDSYLICGDVDIYASYKEVDPTPYYVYRPEDISIETGNMINAGTVSDEAGNFLRFTTPSEVRYHNNDGYLIVTPRDDISAAEYPVLAVSYRSNIKRYTDENLTLSSSGFNGAISVGLKYRGSYRRFWGPYLGHVNGNTKTPQRLVTDGTVTKAIVDISVSNILMGASGLENLNLTVRDFSIVDKDSLNRYLRISPWGNVQCYTNPGEYFDIQYIGYFKTVEDAQNYVYDEDECKIVPEATHRALMDGKNIQSLKDGEDSTYVHCFRPNAALTRAEAAAAASRILIDDSEIAYKYAVTFTDIASDQVYYDQIAYLQKENYLPSGGVFRPNEAITPDDFIDLLKAVCNNTSFTWATDSTEYVTRAEAARILCDITGRSPSLYGIRNVTIGGFKDVDMESDDYIYIIEVAYSHDMRICERDHNNEEWLSAVDEDFYLTPAPSSLIAELNEEFESRKAEVLSTASDYTSYYVYDELTDSLSLKTKTITGQIYYVSNTGDDTNTGTSPENAIKTLDEVMLRQTSSSSTGYTISAGDVVLLERGGEWHTANTMFTCLAGVTYSAYGSGAKPKVYGSISASSASDWAAVEGHENLYRYTTPLARSAADVGNIVFYKKTTDADSAYEAGEYYGWRMMKSLKSNSLLSAGHTDLDGFTKSSQSDDIFIVGNGNTLWEFDVSDFTNRTDFIDYTALCEIADDQTNSDLMYFHYWTEYLDENGDSAGDNYLYLYCREGNPAEVFQQIELCVSKNAVRPMSNNIIDNWAILCTGAHGVGGGHLENLTVRNCEIGWIGGSVQNIDDNNIVRYGNGVEIFGKADGYYVYNNYIYQCFDCGPTVQWQGTLEYDNPVVEKNTMIFDNVLDDADLEVWLTSQRSNSAGYYAILENCKLYNNLVKNSGYGFGGFNHQKHAYCSFYGAGSTNAPFRDCEIYGNKFWNVRMYLMKAVGTSVREELGFDWHDNTIIMDYDSHFSYLAADTKIASGAGKFYENYNNELITTLLGDGCLGFNDFYYTLPEGAEDPLQAHLALYEEEVPYIKLMAVAKPADVDAGNYFTIDGTAYYYYNQNIAGRTNITITANPTGSYKGAYWIRVTQSDNTKVLLSTNESVSAYPLGTQVLYEPVFLDASQTIKVDKTTKYIITDTTGYNLAETAEQTYTGTDVKLTVEYYTKAHETESVFTVKYYNSSNNYDDYATPVFGEGFTLTGRAPESIDTKWTALISGKRFTLSYKRNYLLNYLFADDTYVKMFEEARTGDDNADEPILHNIFAWKESGLANFTAAYELPEDCTGISHGMLLSSDYDSVKNAREMNGEMIVADNVIVGRIEPHPGDEKSIYLCSKILSNSTDIWYARAYLIYERDGIRYVKYADDVISSEYQSVTATVEETGLIGDIEVYSPIYWDDEIIILG